MTSDAASSAPTLRLDPDQIRRLVHYLHPIPLGRGLHLEYVRRTYPGWEWDPLFTALRASGVLHRTHGHPPLRCDPHVAWLEVHPDGTTRAVWRTRCPVDQPCLRQPQPRHPRRPHVRRSSRARRPSC